MPHDSASVRNGDRLARLQAGMEAIRSDWRTYFEILAAAPDQEARITRTAEHFKVDEDVAAIALDQPLQWFIGRAGEEVQPSR